MTTVGRNPNGFWATPTIPIHTICVDCDVVFTELLRNFIKSLRFLRLRDKCDCSLRRAKTIGNFCRGLETRLRHRQQLCNGRSTTSARSTTTTSNRIKPSYPATAIGSMKKETCRADSWIATNCSADRSYVFIVSNQFVSDKVSKLIQLVFGDQWKVSYVLRATH